jgi:hypothetical protein
MNEGIKADEPSKKAGTYQDHNILLPPANAAVKEAARLLQEVSWRSR